MVSEKKGEDNSLVFFFFDQRKEQNYTLFFQVFHALFSWLFFQKAGKNNEVKAGSKLIFIANLGSNALSLSELPSLTLRVPN